MMLWLSCLHWTLFLCSHGNDEYPAADQPDYWNQVYKVQSLHGRSLYEWYGLGYQQLHSSLMELLEPLPAHSTTARLLVLGSGDSALSAELASDQVFENVEVISIDFSAEVTERMRRRFPDLTFLTMDARNMSDFDDGSFVAAIDKGLSDCLGTVASRRQYFQEVRRVLVQTGRLLVVSQRRLWAGQDLLSDDDEDEPDTFRELHSEAHDLGPGWSCKEQEMYGPLFMESDEKQPPFPQPGTEGTIPYFLLACRVSSTDGGAGIGLLFILPRLIASLLGAPRAAPLPSVLQDVAVNFGAMVFCGFLTYQEWNQDSVRSQAKEEGALIARLPVQVPTDGEVVDVQLSDLRVGRRMKSRRPVLCLGNLKFCQDCIDASMAVQEAMIRTDFLLVPVLCNPSEDDAPALAAAVKDLSFVALPGKDPKGDWALLSEIQLAQVRSQGLDEDVGQAIIIKKNGRVGTRFLGVPDWKSLTAEVDARVKLGLDTRNV
ncbi:Methyltransferase-like protein 13 [Symbiodinium microadriaticum]|uniref:Methyltransferase-like protein 13 n=1 Tax=Symbiodinium microadriaticum TaxID=2951 RepID=A0A1Q9ELH6_SYMMI|nr:Methyltransferase-like protein 13 [Symbiodinium microadriaticum]